MNKLAKQILSTVAGILIFLAPKAQTPINTDSIFADTLRNGMQIIIVVDTNLEHIYYDFYLKYPTNLYNEAVADIYTNLIAAEKQGRGLIIRRLVSDSNAVDSSLRFLNYRIFQQKFTAQQIAYTKKHSAKNNDSLLIKAVKKYVNYDKSVNDTTTQKKVSYSSLEQFRKILSPNNTQLVILGNISPDSTLKIADSIFSARQITLTEINPHPKTTNKQTQVYFVDKKNVLQKAYAVQTITNPAQNFIETLLLKNYIKNNFTQAEVLYDYSLYPTVFTVYFPWTDSISLEYINRLPAKLKKAAEGEMNYSEVRKIKKQMQHQLDSMLSEPSFVADMIFFNRTKHKDFNTIKNNYLNTVKTLSSDYNEKLNLKPFTDKIQIFIAGNRDSLACTILSLTKQYKVNYIDRNLFKYKIVQKGFDVNTIINRYVKFVFPQQKIKNLSVEFEGKMFVDSTFFSINGYIMKKAPGYYRYETFVILPHDTLFHTLEISDGKTWLDSNSVGSQKVDANLFNRRKYKTYILPELYYTQLAYKPKLICENSLINQNIYKVKVTTPDSVYFYDYYDMGERTKIKTIVMDSKTDKWLETIYYDDYRRIGEKVPIKTPYTIKEQTPYYTLEMRIKKVSTQKIDKKTFRLNNRVESRSFEKIFKFGRTTGK